MIDKIKDQHDRVHIQLRRSSIPPEVEEDVREELSQLGSELVDLQRDGALTRHYKTVIDREVKRFEDNERSDPLCSCGDVLCPVRQGDIPAEVKMASGPFSRVSEEQALRDWMNQHQQTFSSDVENWPPRVAYDEYAERFADLYSALTDLYARLKASN
jgi:hypothetical protein